MSKSFVVVHEAQPDFTVATELADRVFLDHINWLDATLLESQRQWVGDDPPRGRLTWKAIRSRARELGIRVHGHFDGEPALPDANAARKAIAYVLRQFDTVDAIVLIRDADDQNVRRQGLEQARALFSSQTAIVIGLAVPERECWVISGFEPENDDERQRLESEIQKLGFNPSLRSHELTAVKDDRAKRSPKRVLKALANDDIERERNCWQITPLTVLEERGRHNGLKDYLREVEELLSPLMTGYQGSPA
ncbi:MAG: hypothetical protein HYS13_17885 [Planctomycetia bacterium]|nr:hypothetical protein [Planctomycetia bacterium]